MSNKSEAAITQEVLLAAAAQNITLWRNNVGALPDNKGRYIRYGLCNDSPAMNRQFKSSDLIGITPVIITPDMIGQRVGVFTSYEVKKQHWKWNNTVREVAQANWLQLIVDNGGIAAFVNDPIDIAVK